MKRSLLLAVGIVAAIVVYAYGFSVTQVNLAELGSPTRQESLTRILRALARPDFFTYEQQEFQVEVPIYVPCPPGGVTPPEPADPGAPYMVVTPPCADPGAEITVEGFNFAPNTSGPLNFIPPSGVSLSLGRIETDRNGHFVMTVRLRNRTSPEPQLLRAVTRRNVGLPRLSQNGIDTIDKIIETVFMALLATTLGTLLAVPISFFAARNLMRMVRSSLPGLSLSLLAAPVGVLVGAGLAGWIASLSQVLTTSLALNLGGLIVTPVVVWGALRWGLPQEDATPPSGGNRLLQVLVLLVSLLGILLMLYLLGELAMALGEALATWLGPFAFLGTFVATLGEILRLILVPICALIGAGLAVGLAGRVGQLLVDRVPERLGMPLNLLLAAAGGATLALLLGALVNWFYQLNQPWLTYYGPALVGAAAGLVLAWRVPYRTPLPVGLAIYSVTRTILNALRSVEALIMVIVFAVWVGIGPFAGVLALGLHTVAALAKLYSEQVESIMTGPLEAVLATGASRMQMVIYAVIPQIIPPYISFTMYRWDINVRMSTIIGFAGGGGIGFLLQQNINLLNYRAASAQILAIAIVVSLMDYISSLLRERAI
ncbi:MAG: hypothetical protein KatS3mg050_1269 [Litorilinea sp.]|nr:MAG: hypothetical protein KatS3mg050_1269 [Litorilinea sp.]